MPNFTTPPSSTGRVVSRRQALKSAGAGFGMVALAGLLGQSAPRKAFGGATGRNSSTEPLAPKPSHFPVKAKRIIFLFMEG
ncbi:MAG TPA: DUF1501 domain-containing protein, partial [Planctomycetaceae bacterium]|nr:DUF1501 domain-containing protein [Planctomycetaceae bacterium]